MAVYKRGDSWVADFRIGGRRGRRVRKSAPTRELAQALEREEKVAEFRGETGILAAEDIDLFIFIKKYQDLISPTKSSSTRTRDTYTFTHIRNHFGDRPLRSITPEQIEAYKAHRARHVKLSTVNRELDLLKGLLNQAGQWGYLRTSPATHVRRFKIDLREPVFLSAEEGRRLSAVATGQMKTFIVVALNTGLRKDELFALKWSDIDFAKAELRVRKSKGKRFRVVPLNHTAVGALQTQPRHINSPLVFHNSDGSPWKDVRGSFQAALARANLPKIRLHDLRHSFVSNLVAAGVDLRTVQELAGHRSIQTTMNYAHLRPGALKDGVAVLETV